ncbi:MAG: heparan-alpha-glucosaminide N-acetyltransferase domain-containing protein [Candidatus Nanopelagicales bacterium]
MSATDVAARRGIRGKAGRIVGVDVARGIALLTMAATHMLPVHSPSGHLTHVGFLFGGRASALFAMLAGVSLAIVTGGSNPKTGRDLTRGRVVIAIRAVVIGLIGLLLAMTDTIVAVILAYYAVYFLLAIPFLRLRPRTLLLIAAAWALVSPQLSFLIRGYLPDPPYQQVDVVMILTDPVTALPTLLFTGYYPAFTWMTFILVGLAVGRSDLRARATAVRLVVAGAVLAVGAWVASGLLLEVFGVSAVWPTEEGQTVFRGWELNNIGWYGTTPTDDPVWLLVAGPHAGTTFDLVTVTGSALAVLGLCLLLTRPDLLRRLLYPLAAVGAMTLTLYSVHVVVLSFDVGHLGTRGYYLTHVAVALIVAPLWLWFFSKGPLEALVHEIATGLGRALVPLEPAPAPDPAPQPPAPPTS